MNKLGRTHGKMSNCPIEMDMWYVNDLKTLLCVREQDEP